MEPVWSTKPEICLISSITDNMHSPLSEFLILWITTLPLCCLTWGSGLTFSELQVPVSKLGQDEILLYGIVGGIK